MEDTPTPPPPVSAPLASATPPVSPGQVNTSTVPRKSGFPKILLLLLVFIPLIGIGYFLFNRFSSSVKPVTLTYWGLWESEAIMRPVLDEFTKTHPNIKVNYQLQSLREYRERLSTAIRDGRGPDIFRLHSGWIPMFRHALSPVPASVYTSTDYAKTFYPVVTDTLKVGNNYFAIPLEYEGLVMFINDALLTQSGLPAPRTWDELRETAVALSRCDTADTNCIPGSRVLVSGAALGTTDNVDHWQDVISILMLQNNVNLVNPSDQAAEDTIQFYSGFSKSLGIWDSTLPSSTQSFAQGKVGIYFGPSWRAFDIQALNPDLNFSLYPIPQVPIDVAAGEKPVNWASFWVEGVNNKSPNVSAAWTLLKYLSSAEVMPKLYQQQVASGREFGEPYSRVDLANLLSTDPRVSPVLSQAPLARTWYLVSATSDGPEGINTQLSDAFAQVINGNDKVVNLGLNVSRILSQYGLSSSVPFTR